MTMPQNFPNRLRAARLAAGLTQQECAELVGIRQKDWSAYENGHHDPSTERAEELAGAVGYTLKLLPIAPQKR
jgi:transcriptional regulator with XRE-family HTH domain